MRFLALISKFYTFTLLYCPKIIHPDKGLKYLNPDHFSLVQTLAYIITVYK